MLRVTTNTKHNPNC